MNRTTVLSTDSESILATERGSVDEYREEREQQEDSDVLSGLREMDGSAGITWRVYRIGDIEEDRNGWVCDVSRELLSMQHLANKLGPGTYRVEGVNSAGRYVARRTVKVAGDAQRATHSAPQSAHGGGSAFNIDEWERRQEQRDERRRKERNELLAIMVPALGPIAAALLGRTGPDLATLIAAMKPPPPPDPIQMIAALKQLSPQVEQGQPSAMETAFKIMDRLKDLTPGEGGTSWLDVFKELARSTGPTLGTMIEGAMTRAQTTSAASPQASLPAPIAVADGSASATQEPKMFGMLKLMPWLKRQLEMCLQKASRGSDPELIAAFVIDDLPDDVNPQDLLSFIQRPDWWTHLQGFDSRVSAYGPWFARMRQSMLEQFSVAEAVGGALPATLPPAASAPMTVTDVTPEPDRPSGEPPKLGL